MSCSACKIKRTFECPNCRVEMKMLSGTVAWCYYCGTAIQTVLNLRHNPKQHDTMQNALRLIIRIEGCECDDYNGHKCVLCRIRDIAGSGLDEKDKVS